ncbi:hypothetical protein [Agrilutibacter solisilvae]|uniref:Uncharacterized protein n=1 Tax=Agrilutibacter solisilvae TaxID=2763317 RepID=A0A975ATZ9_9GAMM|nr:hypothetical protein [Lysobacter solisilvae]QSX79719.1 hypothetical protein I8J32_007745 [Lysobacter solisilvae]
MSVYSVVMISSAVICFAFVALGSWLLRSLVRIRASRALFAAVVAFPLWIPCSAAIGQLLDAYYHPPSALEIISAFATINAVAVSVFAVVAAVSFWLVVRQMNQRANNSFKPDPLGGRA